MINTKNLETAVKAHRKVLNILIISAFIVFLIGLFIDRTNMLLNILAEISGVFMGAIFTLLILDTYSKTQKHNSWKNFKKNTIKSLKDHILYSFEDIYSLIYKEEDFAKNMNLIKHDLKTNFSKINLEFMNYINTKEFKFAFISDYMGLHLSRCKYRYQRIREIIIPRILFYDDNDNFLSKISNLEIAIENYENILVGIGVSMIVIDYDEFKYKLIELLKAYEEVLESINI